MPLTYLSFPALNLDVVERLNVDVPGGGIDTDSLVPFECEVTENITDEAEADLDTTDLVGD